MIERLRDVLSVKMVITYRAEHYQSGLFDTEIEYTFIHPDYSEEVGTVRAEGKTGTSVTLEVVSKNDIVVPKHVLKPFKVEASFQPNSEFKVTYTESHSTFETTLSKEGQTFKLHTISSSPEHERIYEVVVDVASKKIIFLHKEDGTDMTHMKFLIDGNLMNLRKIEMKGKIQATRWFEAGKLESTFLVKGNDYKINLVFNDKEIVKTKVNVQNRLVKAKMNFEFLEEYKGTVYFDYDSSERKVEVKFPREWFADKKSFVVTFTATPSMTGKPLMGGIYTATLLREDIPFFQFDLDYNFAIDGSKYEFVLNKAHVQALNAELVDAFFYMMPITKYEFCSRFFINGCFSDGIFSGKIFIDRENKNNLFNKFIVEGSVVKMGSEVFNMIFDTVSSPYKFTVFYPRMLQRLFNKPMDVLSLTVENVSSGNDYTLILSTNVEDMVFEFKRVPQHMSIKITKNQVTYIEFVQNFSLADASNTFLLTMKPKLNFHTESYIHKELCHFSKYTCFTELVGDVKVEVADKAAKKIDMKVHLEKDSVEIYHLEASNKQAPYNFVFRSPYVVPFFKYMRGQSWLSWMMPVVKSPFDVEIQLHPVEKTFKVNTDIDTYKNVIEIVPLGGDRFNILFNNEVVVEFLAANKAFELSRTLIDGTPLKLLVNWETLSMLENTVMFTVFHKDTKQEFTVTWNAQDLAHGKLQLNAVGSKVPMFGDFELSRNINWNVMGSNQFEVTWTGKAASNMMKVLTTPVMTDAKITFTSGDFDVLVKEMFNSKTFTLMFKNNPFKFAVLPFFEV